MATLCFSCLIYMFSPQLTPFQPLPFIIYYISNELNLFSYTRISEILGNYPVRFCRNDF